MIKTEDLEKINYEVARELCISKDLVDRVIKHFYGELRGHLTDPKFNSILIHKLGSFEINQGALRHMLNKRPSIRAEEELYKQFINLLNEKYKDEFKLE